MNKKRIMKLGLVILVVGIISIGIGANGCPWAKDDTTSGSSGTPPITLPDPPNAPSSLVANTISSSQIYLTWVDNSDNEYNFELERKTGPTGTWSRIATPYDDVTSYNDTGRSASTTYYYRVRASGLMGVSSYSNEAWATTSSGGGADDAWDPTDDTALNGTWLSPTTSSQSHGSHTLSSTDLYDWFRISMTAGRTYYFSSTYSGGTATSAGTGDSYAALFSDSAGSNQVASGDDEGGNCQFSFSYTAASTQTYYLRVQTYAIGSDWSGNLNYYYSGVTAGILSVTPSDGLTSSGNQGGPFNPSSKIYTLQNTGGSSINWTASKGQTWVSLSLSSGTLAAGASTTVTVSINSNANSLTSGSTYNDTVSFTNTTNGNGNTTRSVSLSVIISEPPAVDDYVWVANWGFAGSGNTVTRIQKSNSATTNITVGTAPYGVAVDGTYCYVANRNSNNVTRITKSTLAKTTIAVGSSPSGVAVDATYVWVANNGSANVTRINKSNLTTTTIAVGSNPYGIAVDATYVWVANTGSNNVTRITKSTSATTTIAVGTKPWGVAVDGTYCWVANYDSDNVTRIRKSDLITTTIAVGDNPLGITVDETYCWVANEHSDNVTRITKSTLATTTITVGSGPCGIAVDGTYVWVANRDFGNSNTVTRILKSNNSTTTITVGTGPYSLGDMTGYAYDNYSTQ